MLKRINEQLNRIEKEHAVKILLACESGSRAWGFPSTDSDYDVRFIYARPTDWYLSIDEKRDVIEEVPDDELDINGWDLRKALRLMRKANVPLMEWLTSPIRYRAVDWAVDAIVQLAGKAFLPESVCHHYLAMARSALSRFDHQHEVKIKTYMYAIRPVLCVQWIVRHMSQPPMHIDALMTGLIMDAGIKRIIQNLIAAKGEHPEGFSIQRAAEIDLFLSSQIIELSNHMPKNPPRPEIDLFDTLFRTMLDKI